MTGLRTPVFTPASVGAVPGPDGRAARAGGRGRIGGPAPGTPKNRGPRRGLDRLGYEPSFSAPNQFRGGW